MLAVTKYYVQVSSLAEETKNPQKTIPRGIIGSLAIAVSIYVGVSLVSTGMVPYLNLVGDPAPLASAMVEVGLGWAAKVVSIGSLLGLTTTTFTCLLGQPRIFYTMARDVSCALSVNRLCAGAGKRAAQVILHGDAYIVFFPTL